jgi:hypothetical protein
LWKWPICSKNWAGKHLQLNQSFIKYSFFYLVSDSPIPIFLPGNKAPSYCDSFHVCSNDRWFPILNSYCPQQHLKKQHMLEGYCDEAICYVCTNTSNVIENNRRQPILLCVFWSLYLWSFKTYLNYVSMYTNVLWQFEFYFCDDLSDILRAFSMSFWVCVL